MDWWNMVKLAVPLTSSTVSYLALYLCTPSECTGWAHFCHLTILTIVLKDNSGANWTGHWKIKLKVMFCALLHYLSMLEQILLFGLCYTKFHHSFSYDLKKQIDYGLKYSEFPDFSFNVFFPSLCVHFLLFLNFRFIEFIGACNS